MSQKYEELEAQLKELFQLERSDLDSACVA